MINNSISSKLDYKLLLNRIIHRVNSNIEKIKLNRFDYVIKSDGSPVSKSDILLQEIIINELISVLPEIKIISEEMHQIEYVFKKNDLIAIIDPIDGTENFCSGLEIWGIAISLWTYPNHIASLLYMPEINKVLMSGQKMDKIKSRIAAYSSSMSNEISDKLHQNKENRITGCSVYNSINVINGSFHTFENPIGSHIWDMLAGVNLALENNCEVWVEGKKYNGQFLKPNQKYRFKIKNK